MERGRLWQGFRNEVGWQARSLVNQAGGHDPFARAHVTCTVFAKNPRHLFDHDKGYAGLALDQLSILRWDAEMTDLRKVETDTKKAIEWFGPDRRVAPTLDAWLASDPEIPSGLVLFIASMQL